MSGQTTGLENGNEAGPATQDRRGFSAKWLLGLEIRLVRVSDDFVPTKLCLYLVWTPRWTPDRRYSPGVLTSKTVGQAAKIGGRLQVVRYSGMQASGEHAASHLGERKVVRFAARRDRRIGD